MASSESFYFTAEFEISSDFIVVQYAEAINYSEWSAGPFDYFVGVEVEIRFVRDGEDESLGAAQGGW